MKPKTKTRKESKSQNQMMHHRVLKENALRFEMLTLDSYDLWFVLFLNEKTLESEKFRRNQSGVKKLCGALLLVSGLEISYNTMIGRGAV